MPYIVHNTGVGVQHAWHFPVRIRCHAEVRGTRVVGADRALIVETNSAPNKLTGFNEHKLIGKTLMRISL